MRGNQTTQKGGWQMSAKQNLIDAIENEILYADSSKIRVINGLAFVPLLNCETIAIADGGGWWQVDRKDLEAILEATK
jgi:hypothetical protein